MLRALAFVIPLLAACGETRTTRTVPVSVTPAAPPMTPMPVVAAPPVDVLPVATPVDVEPIDPVPTYATYELRRGETLAHFARWSELPVETIAEASGLDLAGSYPVGTTVRVPVATPEVEARVLEHREVHREARVTGYLASRGGSVGTSFVVVGTGDTATSIAKDNYGMPVWMLEAYNPTVDLERLRPGDELMVPVLADVVVDAESDTDAR